MRERALLLGTLFSAGFWLLASGIQGEAPAAAWAACLALAFLGTLAGSGEPPRPALSLTARGTALLAGLLNVLCFAFPWNVGGFFLGAAALLGEAGKRRGLLARACLGFGLLLVLQAALWLLIEPVFCKLHRLPGASPWLAFLLRFLGEDAAALGPRVSLATSSGHLLARPTFEGLQAPFFLLFLLSAFYWRALHGRLGAGAALVLCAITAAFAALRYVFNILAALDTERASTIHSPLVLLLSSLPLALFLPAGGPAAAASPARRRALGVVLPAAAVACFLVMFTGLAQPGREKPGRVLIDEHNSRWEMTTRPFDTRWYGMHAGYNYYCLADFLARYYEVRAGHEPLDDAALRETDVLILKTPTAAYEAGEIDAVERFVHGGGSLLLIGDHTNVFGSSEFLNAVGGRFGLLMNEDSQHRIDGPGMTVYEPPARLAHPVVSDLPPFLFGTGCTLAPPLLAEDMIVGRANATQRADYSSSNFFLAGRAQLDRDFGCVSQAAGVSAGAGRVLAFTDSTVFSNFWMYMRGKPELLLGMLNWLNRTNAGPPVKAVALAGLGLALLLVFAFTCRVRLEAAFLSFALALPLAAFACDAANRWGYAPRTPRGPVPEVVFCGEGNDYFLPRTELVPEQEERIALGCVNLYSLPIRVGLVPREFPTLRECLAREPGLLVLLYPRERLSEEATQRLRSFIAAGGRVLVIGREGGEAAGIDHLLQTFGLERAEMPSLAEEVRFVDGGETAFSQRASFRALSGGRPLLVADGGVCGAAVHEGRGCIVFLAIGDVLADVALGLDSQVPTWETLLAYRACFWLFEGLFHLGPGDDLPTPPSMEHYFGADPLGRIAEQLRGR
ncbi:MAG: hypothetical protein HY812_06595 [Planctomycetes bacterium]|nr:hypothetical protein [Planctomycetota bacterium]